MARARNIKPGLFKNEVLGVADPLYTLLFEGLWVLADREGRLEDRPLRIKAEVFPYRNVDVDPMLEWLRTHDFIRRYEVASKRYILVCEFVKHQNPHKNETESVIPPPGDDDARSEEIGTTPEEIGSTRADSLYSDSLYSDSGLLGSASAEAGASVQPKPEKARGSRRCPESFEVNDDLRAWAADNFPHLPEAGLERETAKFRDHTFNRAISDWPATWRNWIRRAMDGRAAPAAAPQSFAERDREAGMARWEEMTGRIHPDRAAAKPAGVVIDMYEPQQLALGGRP